MFLSRAEKSSLSTEKAWAVTLEAMGAPGGWARVQEIEESIESSMAADPAMYAFGFDALSFCIAATLDAGLVDRVRRTYKAGRILRKRKITATTATPAGAVGRKNVSQSAERAKSRNKQHRSPLIAGARVVRALEISSEDEVEPEKKRNKKPEAIRLEKSRIAEAAATVTTTRTARTLIFQTLKVHRSFALLICALWTLDFLWRRSLIRAVSGVALSTITTKCGAR